MLTNRAVLMACIASLLTLLSFGVAIAQSDEAMSWLLEQALPLSSMIPGSGFEDLEPLRQMIGDARVVGLGEATHGTLEFSTMKHRLVEFLVQEMGFTLLAIEANMPEAYTVNDYIQRGEGDPRAALDELHFWTCNTQEILDMIEWMRAYNLDLQGSPEIGFYGFDMSFVEMALDTVADYLWFVDPEHATTILEKYAAFESYVFRKAIYGRDYKQSDSPLIKVADDLQTVLDWLLEHEDSYIKISGESGYHRAVNSAHVVVQNESCNAANSSSCYSQRDVYMAENVARLLDQAGEDAKIILWGHNGHIGESYYWKVLGQHLRDMFGDDYFNIGFALYEGTVTARQSSESGVVGELKTMTIAPPPSYVSCYESVFRDVGHTSFLLDLSSVDPRSPVGRWLNQSRSLRSIGATYSDNPYASEDYFQRLSSLPRTFNCLIYIQETTASQVLLSDIQAPILDEPANLGLESNGESWTLTGVAHDSYCVESCSDSYSTGTCLTIRSNRDPTYLSTSLEQAFVADRYLGKRVKFSASLRTENVTGWTGLWIDTNRPRAGFLGDAAQDMGWNPLSGSTDWVECSVEVDVGADDTSVYLGLSFYGAGTVWIDNVRIEIVEE